MGGQSLMQQTDANQLARARGAAGDQYSIGYQSSANDLSRLANEGVGLGYNAQNMPMQQQIMAQQMGNQLGTAQATDRDLGFNQTLEGQQHALMSAELAARTAQANNPYSNSYEFKAPSVVTSDGRTIVNPAYQAKSDMGVEAKAAEEQIKANKLKAILNGLVPTAQQAPQPISKPRVIGISKDGKPITF